MLSFFCGAWYFCKKLFGIPSPSRLWRATSPRGGRLGWADFWGCRAFAYCVLCLRRGYFLLYGKKYPKETYQKPRASGLSLLSARFGPLWTSDLWLALSPRVRPYAPTGLNVALPLRLIAHRCASRIPAAVRRRNPGHCLETASLHPPQAALRRFPRSLTNGVKCRSHVN